MNVCDTDSDKRLHFFPVTMTAVLWLDSGMLLFFLLSLYVWHWLWTESGALTLSLSHVCGTLTLPKCLHSFPVTMTVVSQMDSGVLVVTLTLTKSLHFVPVSMTVVSWFDTGVLVSLPLSLFDMDSELRCAYVLPFPCVCVWHWLPVMMTVVSWLDSSVLVSLLLPLCVSHWLWTQARLCFPFPMCVCDTDSDKALALLPCDDGGRIAVRLRHAFVFSSFSICLTLTLNWIRCAYAFPVPCVWDTDSAKVLALLPCDDDGRITDGLWRACGDIDSHKVVALRSCVDDGRIVVWKRRGCVFASSSIWHGLSTQVRLCFAFPMCVCDTDSLWWWRSYRGWTPACLCLCFFLYVFHIDSELRCAYAFPIPCVCDTDSDKALALLPCDDGGRIVFGLRHACVFAAFSTCWTLTLNSGALMLSLSHVCVTLTLTKCMHFFSELMTVVSRLDSGVFVSLLLPLCVWHWLWRCAYAFPFPCVCDTDSDKALTLLPCDDDGRIVFGLQQAHVEGRGLAQLKVLDLQIWNVGFVRGSSFWSGLPSLLAQKERQEKHTSPPALQNTHWEQEPIRSPTTTHFRRKSLSQSQRCKSASQPGKGLESWARQASKQPKVRTSASSPKTWRAKEQRQVKDKWKGTKPSTKAKPSAQNKQKKTPSNAPATRRWWSPPMSWMATDKAHEAKQATTSRDCDCLYR